MSLRCCLRFYFVKLCLRRKKRIAILNSKVLAEILDRAKETESDAVVIWKDGKLAHEAYFEKERGRIESMSATKSVVALAFGLLLAVGKLTSLDEPVHKFFPEWNQGLKAELMTHRASDSCSCVRLL